MPNFSRAEVVLVRVVFSDGSGAKIRPAVVVSAPHMSQDLLVVPLTSRTASLLPGEFVLSDWRQAGLNVPTAAKRGVLTITETLILRKIGTLSTSNTLRLDNALREWLALPAIP